MLEELTNFLRTQEILSGCSDEEINTLKDSYITVRKIQPGEFVVQTSVTSNSLFFVFSGEFVLIDLKDNSRIINVEPFVKGNFFGDMAFLDNKKSSTAMRATEDSVLLELSNKNKLREQEPAIYQKIIHNITKINIKRLRRANHRQTNMVKMRTNQLKEYKKFAHFFLFIIMMIGVNLCVNSFKNLIFPNKSILSNPLFLDSFYLGLMILPTIIYLKVNKFVWKDFKSKVNPNIFWHEVLYGTVVAAIVIGAFLGTAYISYEMFGNEFKRITLHYEALNGWYLLSLLFNSLIREFIARILIQTTLIKFLGDTRGITSNIVTAFIFGAVHLYMGITIAGLYFIFSVVLGWIYHKRKSLSAVIVADICMRIFVRLIKG